MENQFMSTPLLKLDNKKGEVKGISRKDELIRNLQLKNNKLKTQIYKIKAIIQEKFSQNEQQTPQKRQSIIRSTDNIEILNQQLTNAYKKIKMYEYEINKMEQGQAAINLSQRATQFENTIKQKRLLAQKLKGSLLKEQKIVNENSKKLSNNSKQQEIQKQVKSLNDQIKFFKGKLKEHQNNSQMKQQNLKKQYAFVQKLQNELIENGFSHAQLQEIKTKIMKKATNNIANQTSVDMSRSKGPKYQQIEVIQDRTIDRYKSLQNEVKLLEKMKLDYQKQINTLEEQKKQAINKNLLSRNKIIQCQNEIQKLQKEVQQLKGKVLPSNMKPLKPLRSVSSQHSSSTKPAIKSQSISKNTKQLSHMLKFDEVGMTSQNGQRFTDRNILGKSNLNCAIIGMTIYIDKITQLICGIQSTYSGHKKGGIYLRKDRELKQVIHNQEKFMCEPGDVFKSISGTLSSQDMLQSLNILTKKNNSHRFGNCKTTKKSFSFEIGPDEVPVCIFGSLLFKKQAGKRQITYIQHFGVEINKQKGSNQVNIETEFD